ITIDMIPGTRKSVASFLDITERKKAEERLREREEHFKALFYQNSSVLMLVDPETGKIHDVNNKAAEFYGYSLRKLKSMNVQDINMLSDEQVKAEMNKAARQERDYFIFSHQLANKEIRDVEVYTGPITIQGKPLLYSTIHDITQETQNRTRLQKGEQIARIGHWEFDLNNRRVYASKGARNIYGIQKENLDMDQVQQVPLEDYRQKLDQTLIDLVQKGQPYDLEFKIKRPSDDQVRDIHSIAEYDPRRNVVFGIIQDITERKETEKELNAQKRKEYLSIIHGRTKHLLQIINDIVDISKIEANQLDIQPENFNLNELLNKLYQEQIKEMQNLNKSHIKLYLSKDKKKSSFHIKADSNRLRKMNPHLPVIAQTAHAMEEDRKKCLESGATNYISKPIDLSELLSLMNRYL
ncbi:MAG: PAS domain S-box protein, partial [Bacteroidales bacterium]|nr:PAS domain S-box protein [Bacteroidales bacterium]